MAVLWMNLAIVYIFSFFSRYFAVSAPTNITYVKPNKLMVFVVILCLVLVSGLRNNIGDTFFYMHAYSITNFNWEFILSNKDIGFGILQMVLQQVSADPQLLVFVTAFITNLLIVLVLYKYSRLFELSLYVYITGGMHLVSMNGIRQFLAGAIIFAGTKYILEGNWKKFIIIVLIASTIHQSALIFIPIYFLIREKAWSKTTFILLFSSVLVVIGFNQFSGAFYAAIEETQYGNYSEFHEGGTNIIRVIVYAIPIILAYFGRDKLKELFPKSDPIVNLSILGLVFMIISLQNWIFARFIIYFGLYQLILISWVTRLFTDKNQKFVYYMIIVCYFLYYFYENVISLRIIYESNFIKI